MELNWPSRLETSKNQVPVAVKVEMYPIDKVVQSLNVNKKYKKTPLNSWFRELDSPGKKMKLKEKKIKLGN